MLKALTSLPIISKFFDIATEQLTQDDKEKTIEIINQTIQAELKTDSAFVRNWRPCFGYCVSVAWLMYMCVICYVVITDHPNAPDLIYALCETASLWGVALGVLGISVIKRSSDKKRF